MKNTILSTKQSDLLEKLLVTYGQIVSTEQVHTQAQLTGEYKQTKNIITKLVENGWLIRIKQGLYAISDLSSRGFLAISPYLVANLIVPESYVSFESALQKYGMFDQLTEITVSISLKKYKALTLSSTTYSYINTKPKYYFGWKDISIDNRIAHIATPEKALIDIINFHKSQYSIDFVIEKLNENKKDLDFKLMSQYLEVFPLTIIRSFGLIFDLIGINSDRLYAKVRNLRNYSEMLPDDTKFNAKWRIYYNPYFDKYHSK
ncbi:MAG: hypothetical protein WCO33_00685 [bacterium]